MRNHTALKGSISANVETWLEVFSGPPPAWPSILIMQARGDRESGAHASR